MLAYNDKPLTLAFLPSLLSQALERVDKVSTRVETKKQRKVSKLSLKHMY
jgi:hypothetical protein